MSANKNLFISFSGGRTSALMTKLLLEHQQKTDIYKEVIILFANTGLEHEETLTFIHKCETFFNFPIVWVEAVIRRGSGNGTRHKIVQYDTASRKGEPFEAMVQKYGIPNNAGMFCTRELKLQAMTSYLRSIGWRKNDYVTAIGIRRDEIDRVSKNAILNNIYYPLIKDFPTTKKDVLAFWAQQPFNLQIPEHLGNCITCWKKSKRKLFTIMQEYPNAFDFFEMLEQQYGEAGNHTLQEKRTFFRNRESTLDLREQLLALENFNPFTDSYYVDMQNYSEELDRAGGCSESCEIY